MKRLGTLFAAGVLAMLSLSPAAAVETTPLTVYSAHVQSLGWMQEVEDGETAGTVGKALRLEALRLSTSAGVTLEWRGHVQSIGWQAWRNTPSEIGTTGKALRLEAMQIAVADEELSNAWTIQYRAHVQSIGWQGWVSDGAVAGTVGRALRMEAVQIRLVPRSNAVTLAFTADTGVESAGKSVLDTIGSRSSDVTNIVGDFAYGPNLEQYFCDQVNSRISGPVQIVAGNHEEMGSEDGYIDDYVACLPDEMNSTPGQWTGAQGTFDSQFGHDYYYDLQNVRVVMISPDIEVPGTDARYISGTPEREWLKKVVREAKKQNKWTILAMHHPCFTVGYHGCGDTTPAVSELAIGLGVDVTISGHDHNYSRTHQIRGTKASPVIVDSDNDYLAQTETTKGSVFAVVGHGGHNPRAIGTKTAIYAAAHGTNSTGGFDFGYAEITVTENQLFYQHVSAPGGPTVVDSFVITR